MVEGGLVRKVYYVDGAHANADQIQLGSVTKDANNGIVTLGVERANDTENANTATRLGRSVADRMPSIKGRSWTTTRDAQKGSISAVHKVSPENTFFFDVNHAKDNVRGAVNTEAANLYVAWVGANTREDADALRNKMPKKLLAFIDKRGASMDTLGQTYAMTKLEGSRDLAGDTTSSTVESFNNMTMNARLAGGARSLQIQEPSTLQMSVSSIAIS